MFRVRQKPIAAILILAAAYLVPAPQLQEDRGDGCQVHVDEDEGPQQDVEDVVDGGVLVVRIDVVPHVVLPGLVGERLQVQNRLSN